MATTSTKTAADAAEREIASLRKELAALTKEVKALNGRVAACEARCEAPAAAADTGDHVGRREWQVWKKRVAKKIGLRL